MHLPFLVNVPWYNNCSLFFWPSKCGEIMLFGVVFIEKNIKNKKKHGTFENLLPHILTMEAL